MFHSHDNHILQPLLDRATHEAEWNNGKPLKATLLELASNLIQFNPNIVSCVDPYYSDAEKDAAVKLLKENGLAQFCKFSPRCRRDVLLAIGAEYVKVKGAS